MDNLLLVAALEYAEIGWSIFPTRSIDGEPYHKNGKLITPLAKSPYTKRGLHDSSTDPEQIRAWWSKYPDAGIGLNCGASKVFSIDIDNHLVGKESGLSYFMSLGIPHDKAWQSLTPSGGIHLIYSDPNGIGRTSTDNNRQVDQRGVGGYVILPPSSIFVINTVKKMEVVDGEDVTTLEMVKEKRAYTKIRDWTGSPMEITGSYLNLLNKNKGRKNIEVDFTSYASNISKKDEERVFDAMRTMPVEIAHDRDAWVAIGMSLRVFGERGWKAWNWWTNKYFEEKPESRRKDKVEYYWNSFNGEGYRINTIFHYRNRGLNG